MRVVDLFAGAGGFSEGARQAGCEVAWAANHWGEAVTIHSRNHPKTIHSCQDLQQADFTALPRYDVLLASPSCQGHSKARGADKPRHDTARSTAWAVVACVEATRPKGFVVENVVEFTRWELFPEWSRCLEKLGYSIKVNTLNAADFGVAQSRIRVFITGSRIGPALSFKIPSKPVVSFHDIMEETKDGWVNVADKAKSTREQWSRGLSVHGKSFLIAYYGSEKNGRSLYKPLGTVTTKERFALASGHRMRLLTRGEYIRAMGFPQAYELPISKAKAIHMLGNAVCPPVAREILTQLKEEMT